MRIRQIQKFGTSSIAFRYKSVEPFLDRYVGFRLSEPALPAKTSQGADADAARVPALAAYKASSWV